MMTTEIPWLFALATEFNDKYYHVPLDEQKFCTMAYQYIVHNIAYRTDGGAILGMILEDPFRNQSALLEQGWYATDGKGMLLLEHFIDHGVNCGVSDVRVCTFETSHPAVTRLLQRRGFRPAETSHSLRIG